MSAIQARIRAFETIGNDTSPKPAGRKPPIKLYDEPEDEKNTSANSTNLSDSADSDPLAKTETLPKRPTSRDNPTTPDTPHIPINIRRAQQDRSDSGDGDDSFHNLVIGSITSDFVKVSPPRSKPPPLPPRKGSENSTNSNGGSGTWSPRIPELDEREDSSSSHGHGSIKKGFQTPRPIPQKNIVQGFDYPLDGGYGLSLSPNPTNRNGRGHVSATSTSSFHDVSLSDNEHKYDGNIQNKPLRDLGGREDHEDHDGSSDLGGLGGSYEAVSPHSSSVFSLLEKSNSITSSPALSAASLLPPALPPRPSSISPLGTPSLLLSQLHPHQSPVSSDSAQRTVPYAVRKAPPPPPPSAAAAAKGISGKGSPKPPPLDIAPQRSLARSSLASIATSASSSSISSFPSYIDKRSSHASVSTTNSNSNNAQLLAKKRAPPPLPAAARARYEAVFDTNVQAQRLRRKNSRQSLRPGSHSRRAVGWRGVSVDLTTTGQDLLMDDDVSKNLSSNQKLADREGEEEGDHERLSGQAVKLIWSCSKLPKRTLQSIWNECDPGKKGALDRSSFVNGMWRIDNELLAAASHHTSTSATASRGGQRFSTIRR